MKIIIVEDNEKIRTELGILLERYGYETAVITNFENAVQEILDCQGQLVLLDINLPIYDGYYICREIRSHSDIPIIIVTSRDSEMDELMSMNLGADDFITKPYNKEILLAHIQSILKRVYQTGVNDCLEYNNLILDTSQWCISYEGRTETLTKNECKILRILFEKKGEMVTREKIMDELWQGEDFIDDNTLTVNVNRIRKKLQSLGVEDAIETKRGVGYRLI